MSEKTDWNQLIDHMYSVDERTRQLLDTWSMVYQEAQELDHKIRSLATVTQNLAQIAPLIRAKAVPYCAPVGTERERATGEIWPGDWVDATGYCKWYFGKWWHTGADLNLNSPKFDADAHSPVYAISDGKIYAIRKFDGWGNVICIRHADCLSRYAHVEDIQVEEGDTVTVGQRIARIGNAGGRYPYHLHFDIARLTARMARYPGDWPGADKIRVLTDYLDPAEFLRSRV